MCFVLTSVLHIFSGIVLFLSLLKHLFIFELLHYLLTLPDLQNHDQKVLYFVAI